MIAHASDIRVKVCGLTQVQDARLALELGASAIGAVHVPHTPRFVSLDRAAEIFACTNQAARVLVVCNAPPEQVAQWVKQSQATHVQLCGSEDPEPWQGFCVPLLRRIGVDDRAASQIQTWRGRASLFVLDHPSSPGGSGKTVDFALAKTLAHSAPCLLAGGLRPENVRAAIEQVSPQGVDASSGLEASPGHKDPDKLRQYLELSRNALQGISPSP